MIYSTAPSRTNQAHHAIIRTVADVTAIYCDGFTTKRHADRIACALNSGVERERMRAHAAGQVHADSFTSAMLTNSKI